MNEIRDIKRALGFGLTFMFYAAWLAWDLYRTQKRNREITRANLAFDNAQEKRESLLAEEGIADNARSRN